MKRLPLPLLFVRARPQDAVRGLNLRMEITLEAAREGLETRNL
jgi:hypothetical protein